MEGRRLTVFRNILLIIHKILLHEPIVYCKSRSRAFLLSSCSSDEPLAGPDANGGKVTFIAEFPTETLTRDFGDGSGIKKLSYAVYEVDAEGNASATPLFATGKADSPEPGSGVVPWLGC